MDEDDSSLYNIAGKSAYIDIKVSEHQINAAESSFFFDPDVDEGWMGFGIAIIFLGVWIMPIIYYGGTDRSQDSGDSLTITVSW